jgi:hypothetical protein
MSPERKFPLVVWEHTQEFQNMRALTEQKRLELAAAWRRKYETATGRRDWMPYVDSVGQDVKEDGIPVFWINNYGSFNTGRGRSRENNWSADQALQNALAYADTGFCTVDELEQFLQGRGPLLERAMHDCGFRPHKKIPGKWVRRNEREEARVREATKEQRAQEHERRDRETWVPLTESEHDRFGQDWLMPNKDEGLNNTYAIQMGGNGMIYVRLAINPFSAIRLEQSGWLGAMLRNKGHIARRQAGFYIEGRNVRSDGEKGVYVKAVRVDQSYVECIWPSKLPQSRIYDLADTFVSRVNSN